ncbi:MAG: hypothetical protein KatS3mg119_1849 [Rhodothalassiaceae bacterium]|nr:MAG: hypothetical protein KatS3mg119_1849 [Rhodothalassiaceae bacterium]
MSEQDAARGASEGPGGEPRPHVIYGLDPSYFTQKVLGFFRYKEIPHEYRWKTLTAAPEVEKRAGTRLIPVVVTPEREWMWDSTPIAFEMDRRFPQSALLPPIETHPVLHVAGRILEDFFDEWPTRQAVHFRWMMDTGIYTSGTEIALNQIGLPGDAKPDSEGQQMVFKLREILKSWGLDVCRNVGADRRNAEEMEGELVRMMQLVAQHAEWEDFLLGPRPSLPDFALLGALEGHFLRDPIPAKLIERHAAGVIDYAERLKAARASTAAPWPAEDRFAETLAPLLQYAALTFHTFLRANRKALAEEREWLAIDIGYGTTRMKARKYAEKTRRMTAAAIAALPEDAKKRVEEALEPLGVLDVYRLD